MSAELLRTLASNFGSNSAVAAKAIRELYALNPANFPSAVMDLLGGPENLAAKRMSDHDLIGDFDCEHSNSLWLSKLVRARIQNRLADRAGGRTENIWQPRGQVLKCNRRCKQDIEHGIRE